MAPVTDPAPGATDVGRLETARADRIAAIRAGIEEVFQRAGSNPEVRALHARFESGDPAVRALITELVGIVDRLVGMACETKH